jgi:hypothetical protein
MPRTYQPTFLPDGTHNPRHVIRHGHASGKRKSLFQRGEFVAWDGEGVTDATTRRHRYVMLMNSLEQMTTVNLDGIPTRDALEMLCLVGEANPRAIHVVFGGSYDVNMMLGDCTYEQVQSVWSGAWTKVARNRFVVNYRPRKSFSVRRTIGSGKRSSIVLWDVLGFFQSTFVDATLKYIGASDMLDTIAKRKAERATFRASEVNSIASYCAMECRMLVALMQQLRDYLDTAKLTISRWDGAGACAASLLKREHVGEHKRAREVTPVAALEAAQCAYAGGRTELVRYGHAPKTPIYHYDINSAYPSAMRSCPSLAHGEWQHFGASRRLPVSPDAFVMVHVEWAFEDAPMYPFFWRSHDTSIYYPARGRGWCWFPEYLAACDAVRTGMLSGTVRVLEWWQWKPLAARVEPFHWIDDLFAQRALWKRQGVGAEKVLKLAINSLYGKTAQHVGGTAEAPPRYHQLEWAGYITSVTRAMVYRACALSGAGTTRAGQRVWPRIIMVATDGVYSLDALSLPCSPALGEWDAQTHTGLTVAQSGVYWTDEADGASKTFCRGFDKGSLVRADIVRAWRRGDVTYDASLTRFVTMGSGLVTREAFATRWRQWRTCPRKLRLSPDGTKRYTLAPWTRHATPAKGFVETGAAIPAAMVAGQVDSAPYPLPWDDSGATGASDEVIDGASVRIVEQEAFDATV